MHGTWQTTSKNRWWRACLVATLIGTLVFPPNLFFTPQKVWAAFVDAPDEQLPKVNDTSYAVATADIDADGDSDAIIVNAGQSRVLLGDGLGAFTDVTATHLPDLRISSMAAVLGDVDGDQDPDLILGDIHGPNRLLLNDGTGRFSLAPASHLPGQPQVSAGLTLGDVDRDGDLDLVVANRRSQNRLWINDGTGHFTDTTADHLPEDILASYDVALGDVDDNGTLDLVVANHQAPDQLLLNNGLGVFSDVTSSQFPGDSSDSFDAELADVDADGDRDIVIAASMTPVRLWINDGNGTFSETTSTHLPSLSAFGLNVDLGDVDADGHLDIVLGAAGQNRVWLGDGSGQFTDATDTFIPVDTRRSFGLALLDTDRDLDPDLLVATPSGANRLLLNVLPAPRLRVAVTPPAPRIAGNPITLTIQAADEDGIESANLSLTDPSSQTQEIALLPDLGDGEAVHTFTPALNGDYQAHIVAIDTLGNASTRQVTIPVLVADVTAPQVSVTVNTPTPIIEGQTISLQVTASDDRGVTQTSLRINSVPVPVAADGQAAFVATTTGLHTAVAEASDTAGNTSQSSTTFNVDADTSPPSVGVVASPGSVALTESVAITVTATDDVAIAARTLRVSGPPIPSGIDLTLDAQGNATFTPFQPGTYTLDATATDPAGNTGMATTTFTATGTPDATPPSVQIQVVPNPVGVGTPVTITVAATDANPIASILLTVDDIIVPVDALGQAIYTPPTLGTYTVSATARDVFGNPGSAQTTFEAVDPQLDTDPPIIAILTPEPGSELTQPTEITGTVQDQTLVRYTLAYAPRGETDFTQFAEGHTNVTDGVLGILDTSLLLNDIYDIRLTAEDSQGRIVLLTIPYQVSGGLKIGYFSMTVQDLSIRLAGLPITITRSYDSRRKTKGDFGIGWQLVVQSLDIKENRVLGSDWQQSEVDLGVISYFCIEPLGPHFVSVTLPDDRVAIFDVLPETPVGSRTSEDFGDLEINCQYVTPISAAVTAFVPRPGTYARLEDAGDNNILTTPQVGLVDLIGNNADFYDPSEYRLTTPEGRVYELDQNFGVRSLTATDGTSLTFETNGILHSDGPGITFTRDPEGRISEIADPSGNTILYTYDDDGNLESVTNQDTNTSNFRYDDAHRLTHIDDARGITILQNIYNDSGQLITQVDSEGNSLDFTHDVDGRREVIRNRLGHSTTYTYDDEGNVLSEINPLGHETTFSYDDQGNILTETNHLQHTTTSTYDEQGKRTSVTDAMNRETLFSYNAQNQLTSIESPAQDSVVLRYDPSGRLTMIEDGVGQAFLNVAYNPQGELESFRDVFGKDIVFTYNALHKPDSVTNQLGDTIQVTYHPNGKIQTLTPPGKPAHTFTYTDSGQEHMYHPPALTPAVPNVTTIRTYEPTGQLKQLTNPDGNILTFNYDIAGRLQSQTFPRPAPLPAGLRTIVFNYDAAGKRVGATLSNGQIVTHVFDRADRLTSSTWQGVIAGSVHHVYDEGDRVVTQHVNNSGHVTFTYDASDLITGAGPLILQRNPDEREVSGTTLGLITDATTYVDSGLIDTYTAMAGSTPLLTLDYTHNAAGRIIEKQETLAGQTTIFGYTYDDMGQLTEVSQDGVNIATYIYDGNGNRERLETSTDIMVGTYDEQDRLTSYGGITYAYTANGERQQKTVGGQTTTYAYDMLGNLLAVNLPDGTSIEYVVDGENRRVGKMVNGAVEQGFLYEITQNPITAFDDEGFLYQNERHPIAELDGNGNIVARFVYAAKTFVPDYMEKGGVTYRIITDHLGSPRLVVDTASGAIAQRLDYDAFGRITLDTNPGFQPFGFGGGLYDPDTGLTRFGARDYDAEIGRWTAKDPIRFRGGDANLYRYAINDPVNLFDHDGQFTLSKKLIAQIVISALAGGATNTIQGLTKTAAEPGRAVDWGEFAENFFVGAVGGGVTGIWGPVVTMAAISTALAMYLAQSFWIIFVLDPHNAICYPWEEPKDCEFDYEAWYENQKALQ